MKTTIRIAAGILTASLVGLSTQCAPYPTEVYHVHHYHSYDNDNRGSYTPAYYGNVNYAPNSSSARSFVPMEKF